MFKGRSSSYNPHAASELKAAYKHSLGFGMTSFTSVVAVGLVMLWLLVPTWVAAGDLSKPAADPDEKLPSMDEMVVFDENAQVIERAKPHYSKMAQIAGLEGVVWIKALVGKDGAVRDAAVYKSSGSAVLDRSALEAAFKSTYKPAVRENQPVAVWVTYRVDFELKS